MSPIADDARLWRSWVAANAWGELAGLGLAGSCGWIAWRLFGPAQSTGEILAFAALAVALGGVEGAIVGWAQARVIGTRIAEFRGWVRATVAGALAAWLLGMLPSTVMHLAGDSGGSPAQEPHAAVQLAFAALLGVVAGPVLAAFQIAVLRRHADKASQWLVANALAWGCAMPVIFAGIDIAHAAGGFAGGLVIAATLGSAGALAGAVHGWFLVRLLPSRPFARPPHEGP